jgi:rhomboid family GlyGly-CTERM serine protease
MNRFTQHLTPITLALISTLCALIGDSATELLRYQSDVLQSGEVWRLLTGNLIHLGWSHMLLNVLGLGLIWGLFWNTFEARIWPLITLISGLAVTLGLYWLIPQVAWYVGLSGLLHGLFVAGAVGGIRRGDRREAILLAAIIGKLLWEQLYGPLPGTSDMAGGPVIVESHLFGAIGGAIAALLFKPRMWC